MRDASPVVRYLDPSQDQFVVTLLEAMKVEAVAHSEGEYRGSSRSVDGCCRDGERRGWPAARVKRFVGGGGRVEVERRKGEEVEQTNGDEIDCD